MADATLLVHRAGKTTSDQAARSVEALEKVGERPVGVILNMVTRGGGKYDYEYGYYYAAYRPDRSDGKRGAHHVDPVAAEEPDGDTDLLGPPEDDDPDTDTTVGPFDGAAGSPRRSSRS